jgi:hypothetical protein
MTIHAIYYCQRCCTALRLGSSTTELELGNNMRSHVLNDALLMRVVSGQGDCKLRAAATTLSLCTVTMQLGLAQIQQRQVTNDAILMSLVSCPLEPNSLPRASLRPALEILEISAGNGQPKTIAATAPCDLS